ncbi:hypothetical protein N7537_005218 [Penicillium hordei]|uniref:Uncharacterized protein n=1 Tax=Penicillium hordei TaxID=40994 RepID=A0AAD6ED80_9EURO|nr:uncharacterized protein N7537_005218 [Penicillium hordei]KAJ5608599.1 hypothetical protein N7537_005218 [Penicillium hordei]
MCSPDLQRLRTLVDRYSFPIACDETIRSFINVDVLPYVDIVMTSLTKSFSGGSDIMAGSHREFYNNLDVPKGPSLGAIFTLAIPYAILAHSNELDWAASYDVPEHTVRISVGLEIQTNC